MARQYADKGRGWALGRRGTQAFAIKVSQEDAIDTLPVGTRRDLGLPFEPLGASRVAFKSFLDGLARMEWGKNPKIGDVLDEYLRRLADEKREVRTVEVRCARLRPFFGHLGVLDLTDDLCKAYAVTQEKAQYGLWTIHGDLNTLRSALKWGFEKRRLFDRPVYTVVWNIKTPEGRQRYLSPEEFWRWHEAATSAHIRLFLLLALLTAQRRAAIEELQWSAVDFEKGIIDFSAGMRKTVSVLDKGWQKKRAVVSMGPTLRAALLNAKAHARTNYVIEYQGKRVADVSDGCTRARRSAGLSDDVVIHTLRHTAASWSRIQGLNVEEIAGHTGHKDLSVLKGVYIHEEKEAKAAASKKSVDAVEGMLGRKLRIVK